MKTILAWVNIAPFSPDFSLLHHQLMSRSVHQHKQQHTASYMYAGPKKIMNASINFFQITHSNSKIITEPYYHSLKSILLTFNKINDDFNDF